LPPVSIMMACIKAIKAHGLLYVESSKATTSR